MSDDYSDGSMSDDNSSADFRLPVHASRRRLMEKVSENRYTFVSCSAFNCCL